MRLITVRIAVAFVGALRTREIDATDIAGCILLGARGY